VDYTKITAVLVEAIKEQQQQIESLKSENQQLKELMQRVAILEDSVKGN
jgi:cell shape-determining protein MreC